MYTLNNDKLMQLIFWSSLDHFLTDAVMMDTEQLAHDFSPSNTKLSNVDKIT